MTETFNRMVLDYDSMASLIQNAPTTFGKWFTSNIAKSNSPFAKPGDHGSLGFRRHRHNNYQAPSMRMLIYFDALLATAQMIASNRRGTDAGKSAHDWLAWLEVEHCVQFGMMTDAFSELVWVCSELVCTMQNTASVVKSGFWRWNSNTAA